MGAGHVVGVHPYVAGIGEVECQRVVLRVVFADIDVEAVAADIMERLADRRAGLALFAAGLVEAGALPASASAPFDKAVVLEFPPDLRKIALVGRKIQGSPYALKMFDL